jgi:hypothetical protein
MFCAPGLVFGGTEGVRSRFHVLRFLTHFWRYRGPRVPFSCFALADSFSTVPRASAPVFMFCAPGHVFDSAEGVESCFHVLRARSPSVSHLQWLKLREQLDISDSTLLENYYLQKYLNLYYYIKHLRIGEFIFYHGNFLLYPFYLSIRRLIFIFGWSNVCDRVHWSPLSLHFFPLNTIISIILFFLFRNLVHIW